jgi:hypothetical protein
MMSPQKIIFSILVVATFTPVATQSLASSESFYQALEKTQKQQYSQSIIDLEILSNQFKKRGDLINAYRAQATAAVVSYERDNLLELKKKGSVLGRDWIVFSTVWGDDTYIGKGSFGVDFVKPPTAIKNFGGLITFDNILDYHGKNPVNGFLDTVVVPKFNKNESIVISCQITSGYRANKQVVALATYDVNSNKYTKIRKAWYPDIKTKRIQSIQPNLVKCIYMNS